MGNSRIASIGNNMMTQPVGFDVVKRQEEAAGVMFADMISMNSAASVSDFTADAGDKMLETVESNGLDAHREKPAEAYEKYQYKDKTIRTETSDSEPHKTEEAVAEVKEFEEAVTEVMEEELHISKEELEAAMEELGLSFLDLLDRGNLANLVVKLTGSENVSQLLCNEAFTNVLQKVNELGTELLAKLQMTPEEFSDFQKNLEEALSMSAAADVESEEKELTSGESTEAASEDDGKAEVIQDEVKQTNTTDENLSENEQGFSGSERKQTAQIQNVQVNEHVVVNHTQTTFPEQFANVETVQTLPPNVTVADIMEQIAEQTRVMISVDTTKMEMQLNPEHLGKLYVEVIENEGAITAKIQTQNAIVKEALDMQIADLKMNLNQAGVKVDSVEVTVASHEFERNLEQDANSKKQQEEAQAKTSRHRNINLNGLDELSGLMTEEETLVAKMMSEQGNSVDFTA